MGDVIAVSAERPVRWGIMGTGIIAHDFTAALHGLPGCDIAAIGSRSLPSAQAFAAKFGAPRAYGSYEELTSDPDLDVVYIATPNMRHVEDVLLCLASGKSVLCEKPMATNADDARRIAQAAQAAGLFCMEAMWMRFVPMVRAARDAVRSGRIGEPLLLEGSFSGRADEDLSVRLFKPEMGGGALLDRGVYLVSLAQYLLGDATKVKSAARLGTSGVDEQVALILEHENAALSLVHSSLRFEAANEARISGSEGAITLLTPFYETEQLLFSPPSPVQVPQPRAAQGRLMQMVKSRPGLARMLKSLRGWRSRTTVTQPHGGSPYRFQAEEVVRCLRAGLLESPDMPISDTIAALEIMDDARRQWREK